MSIDLNWERLTTGPDGAELAERIRDFIHSKFQTVPLPRFIKSVTVHNFEFGTIAPELELKDITDPLPDFYEENTEADEAESDEDYDYSSEEGSETGGGGMPEDTPTARRYDSSRSRHQHELSSSSLLSNMTVRPGVAGTAGAVGGANMAGVMPPGGVPGAVPGGTANLLHHFHSHLAPGWSGTQTPLAAMAGVHRGGGAVGGNVPGVASPGVPGGNFYFSLDRPPAGHRRNRSRSSSISMGGGGPGPDVGAGLGAITTSSTSSSPPSPPNNPALLRPLLREKHSVSTLAPTSAGASRPPTRDGGTSGVAGVPPPLSGSVNKDSEEAAAADSSQATPHMRRPHEPRAEDLQAVFRIRYAGDIKLLLTANILLDYPMPSFVGIPVRLSITGLTFDGVGVLANIRRRVHFCFLGPEDALAAVGADDDDKDKPADSAGAGAADAGASLSTASSAPTAQRPWTPNAPYAQSAPPPPPKPRTRVGGLLQEVRVESEIGQREGGKQSLKNVGKVERFVLEQVRRIFEEEFVYPSFWTFLV